MTPRGWLSELDNEKSVGDRAKSDGHKTDRRSGVFCHTGGMAYAPEDLIAGATNEKVYALHKISIHSNYPPVAILLPNK
ncbi:hypothetical protein A1A1_09341 [Planococcus antarcticus DSM 14505]|uniref:Uncharacterized protein n=1 Tax=Planococcus antarcticus DSM 14505 TaxID=1185653 RepID=A0A1C7DHB4_9BACL|nr:hypothetical protein BBH88_10235 [Planococcus antarcticus DSM 14505]EIM06748.1 hypothetical protein A1A1_09341 [Planococcus antarcticus DSM 14505]